MLLTVTINGEKRKFEISPGDTLLEVLRREGYYEVKKAVVPETAVPVQFSWTE